MDILWSRDCFAEVMALPAAVADDQLKLASKLQLKVLLWFARHAGKAVDTAACAAAIGEDPKECEDAFAYWIRCGILCEREAASPAPASSAPAAVPAAESAAVTPAAAFPAPVTPRPAAVKPQLNEVIARQKNTPQFAVLLDTVSARVGRPLSGGDMETLLYLFDSCGLPAEVIIMITGWAVGHDKGNLRYIEKMALDWCDRGITTIHAAEEQLCLMERRQKAVGQVEAALDIVLPHPTAVQTEAADRWINEWGFSAALLREAYARTMEKTGKFQAGYMNRILEGWHRDNITDPAQLDGGAKSAKPSSLDTGGYEDMLVNYVPSLPDTSERSN